jgi:transglutaminase-like putative cysteine protease
LELEVTGDAAASDLWPDLVQGNSLRREANAVSSVRLLGDELRETADHPVSDRRVQDLARAAVAGVNGDRDRVSALTHFVNGYLRYVEDGTRRHVLALLDDPAGDCSEFADLLTTLARSLDIPSRTVFGLAYADALQPAFRFHAWNELLVGGEWQVVDPTWNQLRVDATHIPMPEDSARALELLTGGLEVAFVVRDVQYF